MEEKVEEVFFLFVLYFLRFCIGVYCGRYCKSSGGFGNYVIVFRIIFFSWKTDDDFIFKEIERKYV